VCVFCACVFVCLFVVWVGVCMCAISHGNIEFTEFTAT